MLRLLSLVSTLCTPLVCIITLTTEGHSKTCDVIHFWFFFRNKVGCKCCSALRWRWSNYACQFIISATSPWEMMFHLEDSPCSHAFFLLLHPLSNPLIFVTFFDHQCLAFYAYLTLHCKGSLKCRWCILLKKAVHIIIHASCSAPFDTLSEQLSPLKSDDSEF